MDNKKLLTIDTGLELLLKHYHIDLKYFIDLFYGNWVGKIRNELDLAMSIL